MPTRLVSLLLVVLAVPSGGQIPQAVQNRINAKTQQRDQMNQEAAPSSLGAAAARAQIIHQDAEELSALSASLPSDLRQLQQGLLVKDLHEKLKKIEKLSKKLRRDIEP